MQVIGAPHHQQDPCQGKRDAQAPTPMDCFSQDQNGKKRCHRQTQLGDDGGRGRACGAKPDKGEGEPAESHAKADDDQPPQRTRRRKQEWKHSEQNDAEAPQKDAPADLDTIEYPDEEINLEDIPF
jgi:hypothetical protein